MNEEVLKSGGKSFLKRYLRKRVKGRAEHRMRQDGKMRLVNDITKFMSGTNIKG